MTKSRELALRLLARIESERAYISLLLDAELTKTDLDSRDKALVTELVYGVVRWQKTLDWYLNQVCNRPIQKTHPILRRILRLGAYQLLFLDRIPPSAAINESVKLAGKYSKTVHLPAKTAKGFVNAALRQLDRNRSKLRQPSMLSDPIARLATMYSYPEWLIQRWIQRVGLHGAEDACRRNNQPPPLIIRVNTFKTSPATLQSTLAAHVQAAQLLPDLPGLALLGHPPLSQLPGYHEGLWTVQNAASMLITLILDPQPGEQILDACAGTGTKTSHLGERMHNQGQITAVDIHPGKLQRLQEHCQRMGLSIVQTHCQELTTLHRPAPGFDRILLDAPCSGLGELRRHPEAKWTKQESDITKLQHVQTRLLSHAATLLRPGGILVYSTCTTAPEENEEVVRKFLALNPGFRIESPHAYLPDGVQQFVTLEGFLQIDPPQEYFDGFFCARLTSSS